MDNMNPVLLDPDLKIHMSLDEIIHMTRGEINSQMKVRRIRNFKKKRTNKGVQFQIKGMPRRDHSIPLLTSSQGVNIFVSKKSPLLSTENKRRIAQSISNRLLNSELIERSKEIVPAEYKLVKSTHGVERVLVPTGNYLLQHRSKLEMPRKLNQRAFSNCRSSIPVQSEDKPPPLITTLIHKKPTVTPNFSMAMDVDTPDDEIIVLDVINSEKQQREVIDAESNLPVNLLETEKLFVPGMIPVPQTIHKTLNDRFTVLTRNISF